MDLMEERVASLEPDVVIFNTGLWEPLPGLLNSTQLIEAGLKAVRPKNGHVFFRTTTTTNCKDRQDDSHFAAAAESSGWKVLETGRYTNLLPSLQHNFSHFYWDPVHFYPQGE